MQLFDRARQRGLRRPAVIAVGLAVALALPLVAQVQEKVDYEAVYKIKEEGLQRSQVMEITSYLTDVYGPRLTGSPSYTKAAEWAQKKFTEWGLANVHTEGFDFGRGWTNERVVAHVVEPSAYPVIAYPKAWTPGTDGPVRAEVVAGVAENEADLEKLKGTLKGKIVLAQAMPEVRASFEPLASRFTEKELADLAAYPDPTAQPRRQFTPGMRQFMQKRAEFFRNEGVVALLEAGGRGTGGTVFQGGTGSRNASDPPAPVQLVLAVEHYGRIWRTIQKKIPVTMEIDVKNAFQDADKNAYNIVAEMPGTDPKLAPEVVMLGGHFDAWHTGTGATDNAAGSAVMMEAVRILKTTGLKMRRTVRIGLWAGEEQGLLGSRAYVKEHFADRETMALKPDHAKFSAYYNVDNGTGAIRGVYLQGNEAVAPIFRAWMEPFVAMGMTTLTPRNTGGTDHLSFDAVGLPGFQFIQDELEYDTRTHHSNMDVYDRIQPYDMMKNAIIVASFVYHTATRDAQLPRKPLPKPMPAGQRPPMF